MKKFERLNGTTTSTFGVGKATLDASGVSVQINLEIPPRSGPLALTSDLSGIPYVSVGPGYYPGLPFTGQEFSGLLAMQPNTLYFSPLDLASPKSISEIAINVLLSGAWPTLELLSGPTWLTLIDGGNGTAVLSGTPSAGDVGSHAVTIRAANGAETVDQSFTIEVQ
jgi:hypothetical protein